MKNLLFISVFALLSAGVVSCNNDTPGGQQESVTEARAVVHTGEVVEVELTSDDQMKYNLSEIRVREGQTVRLTLRHLGTMPKTAMGHNFVLLKKGVDLSDFGAAASAAKAPDYEIPYEVMNDVIAHTRMIGGGESDMVEFVAPASGTYQFLCSFPGHFGMMKGFFVVE